MSENETRADIVREMRNLGKLDEKSTDKIPRSLMGLGLRTYADRLEAAEKREFGNAAAMRDALVEARKVIKAMGGYWARETLPIIDAALSDPPSDRIEAAAKPLRFGEKGGAK